MDSPIIDDFECLQNLINFLIFYNVERDAQTVKCTSLSCSSRHQYYYYYNTIPNENIVNFKSPYFPTLFMGLFFNVFMGTGLFNIESGRPDERAKKIFETRESQNQFFSTISADELVSRGVSMGDRLVYIVDDISKGVSAETARYHNFLMDCCLYERHHNEIDIRNVIDAVYIFLLEKYWDEVLSKITMSQFLRGRYIKLNSLKYEVCSTESNVSCLLDRIFNENEQGADEEIRKSLRHKKKAIFLTYKFVLATSRSTSQNKKPFFTRCFERIKLLFSIKKIRLETSSTFASRGRASLCDGI